MLPYILVFVFAQSVFALPAVDVNFYTIDEAAPIPDNGQIINRNITVGALEFIDLADVPLYVQMLLYALNDLASVADPSSQATAAIQVISVIGELANGTPGDSCESAALINAAVGDKSNRKLAVINYIKRLAGYIDTIVDLIYNPNAVRYSTGPVGNCLGGGRTYPFEKAWDIIISSSKNSVEAGLLNEEYCAAKRLYTAFNTRSNNIAAAVTASTVPQVKQASQLALKDLGNFLRAVSNGGNISQAAQLAKAALYKAIGSIKY